MHHARWVWATVAAFSILLSPIVSRAFWVQPAIVEMIVQPGARAAGTLEVANDEDVTQTFYFSIQKFIPRGENGQQDFLPPEEVSGLPSWMFLDRPSVTLKPGDRARIGYAVAPPEDAPAGGHYAAVFFSNQPPGAGESGQVGMTARTGVLFLVTVAGDARPSLRVTSFERVGEASRNALPVEFQIVLWNEGRVHGVPQGKVVIRNMFGRTVATLPMNVSDARVLPDSSRRLLVRWQQTDPRPASGFWGQVREEWRNFALGSYTATLELTGPGTETTRAEPVRFSVWPARLLVVLVIGLLLLALLLRGYARFAILRATRR